MWVFGVVQAHAPEESDGTGAMPMPSVGEPSGVRPGFMSESPLPQMKSPTLLATFLPDPVALELVGPSRPSLDP